MRRRVHVFMGVGLALAATGYSVDRFIPVLLLSALGSVIPDLDVLYKHRRLLHNVFALSLFSALLFSALIRVGVDLPAARIYVVGFTIGWASHMLGDMLTRSGVRALWPLSNYRFRIARLRYDDPLVSLIGYAIGVLGLVAWLAESPLTPLLRGALSHVP